MHLTNRLAATLKPWNGRWHETDAYGFAGLGEEAISKRPFFITVLDAETTGPVALATVTIQTVPSLGEVPMTTTLPSVIGTTNPNGMVELTPPETPPGFKLGPIELGFRYLITTSREGYRTKSQTATEPGSIVIGLEPLISRVGVPGVPGIVPAREGIPMWAIIAGVVGIPLVLYGLWSWFKR